MSQLQPSTQNSHPTKSSSTLAIVDGPSAAPSSTPIENPKSSSSWNTAKSLFSGAVAGAVSRTATSPLERLKVMKQVQISGNYYPGIIPALARMWREEGPLSYWKGNGTNVARIAPYSAIQFFAFDAYKRALVPDERDRKMILILTAGALSGMTSSLFCYPLDLVRSFLTVQTDGRYEGLIRTMKVVFETQGITGLYRGLIPTMLGIAPYVAINFATFDTLKTRYLPDRSHRYFDLINLGLGAIAGAAAAGLTYPTDVVRRRMQLQGFKGTNLPKYNSTWHCCVSIYRNEGVVGFYKGMVPCFLKVIPSMAIAFAIYERLRKYFKFDPVSKGISTGG